MKQFLLSLSLIALFAYQASAQTYADDVAQIMFDKCTPCHHTGGVAPFPLMTYSEVVSNASWIQSSVNSGNMPPWPPNNGYQQYSHDRSLTPAQITTINNWVTAGTPQGNSANTPPTPTYNNTNQLGTPDLTVRIPDYISKATFGNDDYVCFALPSGLISNRIIQAVEVIPGDPSIVHHALIYIDPAGTYPTDTLSHGCSGPGSQSISLVAGYAPGGSPAQFPNSPGIKMGVNMTAGSNIILAMHYPEGSQGRLDSTRVNIHFYPIGTPNVRQVTAGPILANTSFVINANTVDSVDAWYPSGPLSVDFTLFSVFPHLHLLGQSFIVYAVNQAPPFDQIPLIHIPEWDFEWQDFYVFKHLKKIPQGYKLYGKAIFDNTTNNPYNPNNPPQNIGYGLNTSDEMFLVYFQYMLYQAGDEFVNVDSLLQLQNVTTYTPPLAVNEKGLFLTSYPNPSDDLTTIQYYTANLTEVSLGIYDIQGKLVRQLIVGEQKEGEQFIIWDGKNDSGNSVASGVYISRLKVGDRIVTNKIVRSSK
jgi:hypothetical protein